ncbi:MAG: bifunctional alpha,alpha-trehalose-phosphate synthase (UDP-forming)/trehalose-phosphatase [Planctomycetota bacterium]
MQTNGRLLIVANRLPLAVSMTPDGPTIEHNAGGLATGLRGPHESGEGLWFGWAGAMNGMRAPQKKLALEMLREQRFVPIELSKTELDGYYNQISNGVLWPTFHYLIERFPYEAPDWATYRAINERFADEVASEYRDGDTIWVHDFHLMLLPQMLRERLPNARIGFFLHIPFPSSEVFRVLPWRAELLRGLLGADLIGFHTLSYLRHFSSSLLRTLGHEVAIDRVELGHRSARLVAMPMGIDVKTFDALADDPEVQQVADSLRMQSGRARIVLGIDRLDYTKGLPRRMLAFERLLEMRGNEGPRVQLVQVAVTSRNNVLEYKSHKRAVDELVGRINGRFGAPDYTPIRYVNSGQDAQDVTALYQAADVMLVTPLRDGLNLVAKEFVAARRDEDGVLVLSEFAGVAAELPEALKMSPYDLQGTAEVIAAALALPREERQRRMRAMRAAVAQSDVHDWVDTFLTELVASSDHAAEVGDAAALQEALAAARDGGPITLFLDYDGTLVGFQPRPELAVPDERLMATLEELAADEQIELHIVSGRPREFLEEHFGQLPIGLHGEHGLTSRDASARTWTTAPTGSGRWQPRVLSLMQRFAAQVPGSIVETKTQSVAFHYRQVDPDFVNAVVKEMRVHLTEMLGAFGAAVISGNKVLEVRPIGVDKGNVIQRVLAAGRSGSTAIAFGDDRTDEDMFGAAPGDAITVKVGTEKTSARFRITDCSETHAMLRALLERQSIKR